MTKKTTTLTKEQVIQTYIEELETADLRDIVLAINSYDGYFNYLEWEPMDELDTYLEGDTPTEIIQKAQYGDFNIDDDYFQFDGYGNLVSCDERDWDEQLEEHCDEIAEYLPDFQGDVWDAKLQELIDAPVDALFNEDLEQVFDDDDDIDE